MSQLKNLEKRIRQLSLEKSAISSVSIDKSLFRFFLSHPSFDYLVLKKTAFEGSVKKRRAFGGGQTDELGQAHISAKKVDAPAAKMVFQGIAELGVEVGELLLVAKAHAIRRIGHNDAFYCRRGDL